MSNPIEPILNEVEVDYFRRHGYIVRTDLLTDEERDEFIALFDRDREQFKFRWHPYGYHQQTNYDALVTTPKFDRVIRHPKILAAIEQLMGGPVCFGEIGARYMLTLRRRTAPQLASRPPSLE